MTYSEAVEMLTGEQEKTQRFEFKPQVSCGERVRREGRKEGGCVCERDREKWL